MNPSQLNPSLPNPSLGSFAVKVSKGGSAIHFSSMDLLVTGTQTKLIELHRSLIHSSRTALS